MSLRLLGSSILLLLIAAFDFAYVLPWGIAPALKRELALDSTVLQGACLTLFLLGFEPVARLSEGRKAIAATRATLGLAFTGQFASRELKLACTTIVFRATRRYFMLQPILDSGLQSPWFRDHAGAALIIAAVCFFREPLAARARRRLSRLVSRLGAPPIS